MPKLSNQPLMITRDFAEALISTDLESLKKEAVLYMPDNSLTEMANQNSTAIIQVHGPLSQNADFWAWWSGGTSYDTIRKLYNDALQDDQIDLILFDVNSPGGVVAGVFDLVDEIYESRGKKRTISFINEMAYSAAYAIASATDEIYIPRTGGVGSIGVISMHTDRSQYDKKLGVKYTSIFSGEKKNDYSSHNPLSERAFKEAKAEVNEIFDLFTETVARNRGISVKKVKAMEAGTYQGENAIAAGLVDAVKSYKQIFLQGGTKMTLLEKITNAFKDAKPEEIEKEMVSFGYVLKEGTVTKQEVDIKLADQAKTNAAEAVKAIEKAKVEGADDAKKTAVSILELCAVAGNEKLGLKLISDGATEDEARKQLIETKAGETELEKQQIISTVNPLNTGETNPLIADAKKRVKEAK